MIDFDPRFPCFAGSLRELSKLAPSRLRPIIFLVSSDASVLKALETDLSRRFGNDTRIIGADGPAAGLARLAALADAAEPVALLIADQRMPEMTGVEFLGGAHAAASAGEADPARRARLHDGEPDRARDDARPDRLPPRQAVGPGPGCTRR